MAVAAYARIAGDLREKIESRDIKPGAQLPSELDLRSKYQASRNTVLDAIKMLKDEGLVETRPGQGWFATIRIVPFVNSIDWEDETAISAANARGRKPRAAPPTISRQPAPSEMADRLGVPHGTEMIISADFRTGTSALGSGELEVELASAPPGDGGVAGQVGFAEDG